MKNGHWQRILILSFLFLGLISPTPATQANAWSMNNDSPAYALATSFQFPVGNPVDHAGWDRTTTFGGYGAAPGHLGEDYFVSGHHNDSEAAGKPVQATASGIVRFAGYAEGYGRVVIIEHHLTTGEYYTSVTGHLAHPLAVSRGSEVSKGQLIGTVADDANDGGPWKPHVHFGIRNGAYSIPYPCCFCSEPKDIWVYLGYEKTCAPQFTISNWQNPTTFIQTHQGDAPMIQVHMTTHGWELPAKLVISNTFGWSKYRELNLTLDSAGYSPAYILLDFPLGTYSFYLKPQGMLGMKKRLSISNNTSLIIIDFDGGGTPGLADGNEDNKINLVDSELWSHDFRICLDDPGAAECSGAADFNHDGKVDILDISIWRANYCNTGALGIMGQGWPEGSGSGAPALAPAVITASPELSLTTPTTPAVGSDFWIPIHLDTDGAATSGVEVVIQYDAGALQVIDQDAGMAGIQILGGSLYSSNDVNQAFQDQGIIWFSSLNTNGTTFTGSGILASIPFHASGAVSQTTVSLSYAPDWTTDSNVMAPGITLDQLTAVTDASFAISGTPERVAPGVTISPEYDAYHKQLVTLTATADDPYQMVEGVQFWVDYGDGWNFLKYDTEPDDGWVFEWDTSAISDRSVLFTSLTFIRGGGVYVSPYVLFELDRVNPEFFEAYLYPDSPEGYEGIYICVEGSDSFSGVRQIEGFYNTATDGSESGIWSSIGAVNAADGCFDWSSNRTNVNPGLHRIIFVVEDYAGNRSDWTASGYPYYLYHFGYPVYIPVVRR
jgi:murein DD-endopeptidase MepM/ murein hydrolase activator NlpD